ncbi:hypothetical protein F751_4491 [Auxenochlorella protothecoides]|uniref:Uncharacterized protein n=1 Tax=Auxenochlorella protothecoides TaxID=3075 RepID=A0A087SNB7_AUXPR|nr:hypothetical protein F751_4491 [Auxenochlorella protothecoides]KFM27221.1 hypothetical protein F751_4491 [Auxenochlorella protothecoides]
MGIHPSWSSAKWEVALVQVCQGAPTLWRLSQRQRTLYILLQNLTGLGKACCSTGINQPPPRISIRRAGRWWWSPGQAAKCGSEGLAGGGWDPLPASKPWPPPRPRPCPDIWSATGPAGGWSVDLYSNPLARRLPVAAVRPGLLSAPAKHVGFRQGRDGNLALVYPTYDCHAGHGCGERS